MEDKPVLHLMVNNTCTNDCPLCCNKQYDVEKIPVVTVEDLKSIDTICFTGGQPLLWFWAFSILCNRIKNGYPNIKKRFVYLNGSEIKRMQENDMFCLSAFANDGQYIETGLTMSPKCESDWEGLQMLVGKISFFSSNRIYCFSDADVVRAKEVFKNENVDIVRREWQKNFVPAPNTIFRRLPIWI